MKFIADCHLGKIAKYLRIFGFDTLYFQHIEDNDIIKISQKENRAVLTSDVELYERLVNTNAFYVYHGEFEQQLLDIFRHYKLYDTCRPFTLCIECNGEVEAVAKDEVVNHIPPKTKFYHDEFYQCKKCGKIYWHGNHYKRMESFVDEFVRQNG